jgi:dolichyl-phosphate beta-glucosyltransferase
MPASSPPGLAAFQLSIIIPSFNEELRLPGSLQLISAYIKASGRRTEVLVVDDGSTDGTAEAGAAFSDRIANLRILRNGENRGKGYSVRHGMVEARGENVLFTDADLSAPIEEADKLLSALGQYDVAIGSRAMNRKLIGVHESPFREFAGIIFNRIVRIVLWLPFVDTQCGFKAFRRERCRIIFEQQRIERFGFDPELLYLARHHGLKSIEIPVRWSHSPATKINMLRDSVQMFVDVFTIRWNAIRGRYPKRRGVSTL